MKVNLLLAEDQSMAIIDEGFISPVLRLICGPELWHIPLD
jgi:hypothetical protein